MRALTLISLLLLALVVSACATSLERPFIAPVAIPSPTHLPFAARTAEAIQTQAQATLAAGQAQIGVLDITKTAIALEGEMLNQRGTAQALEQAQINANLTQAAGTQSVFATQTAQSDATAWANGTATQNANVSATTWAITQTPLAATQQAITLQAERDASEAYWAQFTIPFWSFLGLILVIIVVSLLVLAYRRLIRVLDLRLRIIQRGEHNAPIVMLDHMIIDPDRNFGPAIRYDQNGAEQTGLAPTHELQAGVTSRDQAVDMVRALPHGERKPTVRRLLAQEPTQLPAPTQVQVIPPEQARPLLRDVIPGIVRDAIDADIISSEKGATHDN